MPTLALALLLILGAIACGRGDPRGPKVVAGVELEQSDLSLTPFWQVPGTHHLVAALAREWGYSEYASGGFRDEAKDLLFFDATSKGARWLLSDPAKKLRSYQVVLDPPSRDAWSPFPEQLAESTVALGILFEVVPDDPEKQRPAAADDAAIGLANADGTGATILVPGVSRLLGSHLLSRDSLVVFYVRGGELWAADVAPTTRTVSSNAVVSASP